MSLPFVRSHVHLAVVESTNDLAKELVMSDNIELPLVIRSDEQTRGRGRSHNTWWSDRGSLTFTLALDPAAHGLRSEHEPRAALAAAVAIIDAISTLRPIEPLQIRWPNDVEANGKKLGGILPEKVTSPFGPRLLVGIGLNIFTHLALSPAEVRRMATSVAALSEVPLAERSMDALYHSILERMESVVSLLASDDPTLAARWAQLDALRGREVRIDLGSKIVKGVGAGIDAEGALSLRCEDQTLRLFGGRVLRAGFLSDGQRGGDARTGGLC